MTMKRIVNERQYVEDMINNKVINEKRPGKDINLLIKYIYEQNPTLTKGELIEETKRYLMIILDDPKAIKRWQVSIKEYVGNFFSNMKSFRGLSSIDSIAITENELNSVKSLNNKKLEYVAFALLVYLKIKNKINGREEGNIIPSGEEDVKLMKKISGLKISVNEFTKLMKLLQDVEYTVNGIGCKVSCMLNYVDYDSDVIIKITDFSLENIYLYYKQQVTGGRLIHCVECGSVVLLSSKSPAKYCEVCAKKAVQSCKNEYKRTH